MPVSIKQKYTTMVDWLTYIKNAKKESITEGNLKKVRYEFEDGKEMVEEYNMDTSVLSRRIWKASTKLGGEGVWEVEIGDPEPAAFKPDMMIKESSSQPMISRRVTKRNLEWRIRNLPYPPETYSVIADKEKGKLVVRTSNKKYYKELVVPELERSHLLPEQSNIQFSHKFNTLIISYKKPTEVIDLENAIFEEIKKIKTKNAGEIGDCRPS